MSLDLHPSTTPGAKVMQLKSGTWRLEIPPGAAGRYRLAQLDDYRRVARRAFPWHAPLALSVRARASDKNIPGTWGFGLWNDPFGMALLQGGGVRFPVLPNAAWFFFAAPPNYLSLRDDLPAQGALAATFQSPTWPSWTFLPAIPFTPLLLIRPLMRWIRRQMQKFVKQESVDLAVDPTEWHAYRLEWHVNLVIFYMDGKAALEATAVPGGPLGVVIWVDNQYAALPPDGGLGYGTLLNPQPAWIEIEDLALSQIGAA